MPHSLLFRFLNHNLMTLNIINRTTFMHQRFRNRFLKRHIRDKNIQSIYLNRDNNFYDVTVSRIIMIINNIACIFQNNNTNNRYTVMLEHTMYTNTRRHNHNSGHRHRSNGRCDSPLHRSLIIQLYHHFYLILKFKLITIHLLYIDRVCLCFSQPLFMSYKKPISGGKCPACQKRPELPNISC